MISLVLIATGAVACFLGMGEEEAQDLYIWGGFAAFVVGFVAYLA